MADSKKINKRRDLIRGYLLQQPKKTHNEIIRYLKKNGLEKFSQSTIQRDLQKLGFKKTDTGYKMTTAKKGAGLEEQELEDVFAFDEPRIHSLPLLTVSIKVKKGTATKIAELIESIYGNKITGTLVGNGLVIICTTNEAKAKKISSFLKRLRSSAIKSTLSGAEDEDVDEDQD